MAGNQKGGREAFVFGLAVVVIVLLFLFVWPGPFRWQYVGGSPHTKIDRISGTTFVLTGEGWERVATDVRQSMPIVQYSDLVGSASSLPMRDSMEDHDFRLEVYNGSSWAVKGIDVQLRLGKKSRRCRMTLQAANEDGMVEPDATLQPGSSDYFFATVPEDLQIPSEAEASDFHWSIVGAKGYPAD